MSPLMQQFLAESRDFLDDIGALLIALESAAADAAMMDELFRLVHTLKGNSGLFDFPELSRVLHAAEDVMSLVRGGQLAYSQGLADRLLEAVDFAGVLLDEIDAEGATSARHAGASAALAQSLRGLMPAGEGGAAGAPSGAAAAPARAHAASPLAAQRIPAAVRLAWAGRGCAAAPLLLLCYRPEAECFFKGEDPFHQARQTPQLLWHAIDAESPWPPLAMLDPYQCSLSIHMVSDAPRAALEAHFRYVSEQLSIEELPASPLAASSTFCTSSTSSTPAIAASGASGAMPSGAPGGRAVAEAVLSAQAVVLGLPDQVAWLAGRLQAVAAALDACLSATGQAALRPALEAALKQALHQGSGAILARWLDGATAGILDSAEAVTGSGALNGSEAGGAASAGTGFRTGAGSTPVRGDEAEGEPGPRRSEAAAGAPTTLKVEQEKVDRLMNLIGELVVAKNALPYLAGRAETVYGARELAREIKASYAVVNRVAEDMQDAIMQVRMMPVSFVFQRFPRLVRDISRKLGKEVQLVLEGEGTAADKNIIEALADPLVHILRNCLDHGLETPELRLAAGKPAAGRLLIRASQQADQVLIEVSDDGRGINPGVIKRKALEKGLIDPERCQRISDQEAIELVFAPGFSTADVVSDLSGRGVGMDAVRAKVTQMGGSVSLTSQVGQGTRMLLSLPLSMAVSNVMIVESGGQSFGIPMDMVVETVRVGVAGVHTIQRRESTVLRGQIVPLCTLNSLLATGQPQRLDEQGQWAILVIRLRGGQLGLVVDHFREVVDIILKPLGGILGSLPGYAGCALLGDGTVLMVLNPEELM